MSDLRLLPRFTLSHDQQRDDWALKNDATGKTLRRFDTKDEGTKRGVLKDAVGSHGGTVRIQKVHGGYEEERTFPKSRDPRKSNG